MSSSKSYQLSLVNFRDLKSQREYHVDKAFFEAMEQGDVLGADVDVKVDIEAKNEVVYLHITGRGELQVACDRCLEAMELPVGLDEHLAVKYGDEYDESVDGVLTLPQEQTALDLAPLLCESLLLAIPLRHVHEEGGCDPDMARILSEHSAGEEDDQEA